MELLREPERLLTPLFIELLNKTCEDQRVVLILDVFERTRDLLEPWLLAILEFEYEDFDPFLIFIVSGRDLLGQYWTGLAGMVCYIALEPFTLDDTRLYLNNRNITDEQLATQIHADTGGLPVLVELLAGANPQPGHPLPDVSRDAVQRFLQWTHQEEYRQAALLAAVPRQFNRDILGAAFGRDVTEIFNWLSKQSYIRANSERGWFYHDKVRDLMIRYFRNTMPNELTEIHERLVLYFEKEQQVLSLTGKPAFKSKLWRKLEEERIYHFVVIQPELNVSSAINTFLLASRWHKQFKESILNLCREIFHYTNLPLIKEITEILSKTSKEF